MTHRLYPSLQQPVLTDAQRLEQVSEDRWHQPLSEPRLSVRKAAGFAIALIASGQSFDPMPITVAESLWWFTALSEPVRIKQGLKVTNQSAQHQILASTYRKTFAFGYVLA